MRDRFNVLSQPFQFETGRGGAFGAEDVRIMLIEMVTRLAKLQIVALPTPGNPIERQRSPALSQNCIRVKLHSRKSIHLLFVENILVR